MSPEPKKENETNTTAPGKKAAPVFNFMTATDIRVPITYLFFEPAATVEFFCRLLLNDEEIELRQKHFALDPAAKKAAEKAYNVAILSKVATRPPTGLPGFEYDPDGGISLETAIADYFADPSPMFGKLAADAVNYYTTISQPAEFF